MSFFAPKDSTPPRLSPTARQERGRTARESGYDAESAAVEFLQREGIEVIARNVRCKTGEIDIVGRDRDTLVFIEVRLRKNKDFGGAAESITPSKQRRIANAARFFLLRQPALSDKPCRFDCVLMDAPGKFEWLRDAFRLD